MLKTEVKIKNFPHKMSIKSKLHCVCCKKNGSEVRKIQHPRVGLWYPKKNLAQGVKCGG